MAAPVHPRTLHGHANDFYEFTDVVINSKYQLSGLFSSWNSFRRGGIFILKPTAHVLRILITLLF